MALGLLLLARSQQACHFHTSCLLTFKMNISLGNPIYSSSVHLVWVRVEHPAWGVQGSGSIMPQLSSVSHFHELFSGLLQSSAIFLILTKSSRGWWFWEEPKRYHKSFKEPFALLQHWSELLWLSEKTECSVTEGSYCHLLGSVILC